MAVMNLSIDVPEGTMHRFRTLPDNERRAFIESVNAFAVATLADPQPVDLVDLDLIAELRAGDDEAARVGTIPFEEVVARMEADEGPGMVERARARIADYKASPEHSLFDADKARQKAALEAEYGKRGAVV